MTTIDKTIDIPPDRRLHLDLTVPANLPVGKAELRLIFRPVAGTSDKRDDGESGDSLLNANAIELQQLWRDEWEEPWESATRENGIAEQCVLVPSQEIAKLLPSEVSDALKKMQTEMELSYPAKPFDSAKFKALRVNKGGVYGG